jgi:hypothetical protein
MMLRSRGRVILSTLRIHFLLSSTATNLRTCSICRRRPAGERLPGGTVLRQGQRDKLGEMLPGRPR